MGGSFMELQAVQHGRIQAATHEAVDSASEIGNQLEPETRYADVAFTIGAP